MGFKLLQKFADHMLPVPDVDLKSLTEILGGAETHTYSNAGVLSDGEVRSQRDTNWYTLSRNKDDTWDILSMRRTSMNPSSKPFVINEGTIKDLKTALTVLRTLSEELRSNNRTGFWWMKGNNSLANVERAVRLKEKGLLPGSNKPSSTADRVRPLMKRVK